MPLDDWIAGDNETSFGTVIETSRLRLRAMRAADLDDLLTIFGDPLVMGFFGTLPFTRDEMERWLERNLRHQERHGYGLFAVISKESNRLIGDCGLEMMDLGGGQVAELGYDFQSLMWGHGYATEAAAAVRDYAFEVLELPRLVSLIRTGNQASRRVAEKIGMRLEGTITKPGVTYWRYGMLSPLATAPDRP
jgi:RimJ/RimL family protein N-acetyltransferase